MSSSDVAENNILHLSSLRREIQCLSMLLSILSPNLGAAKPQSNNDHSGGIRTIDDLSAHIAMLLSTGLESNLAIALSGSPANIFNMTLLVITEENGDSKGMPLLLIHTLLNSNCVIDVPKQRMYLYSEIVQRRPSQS